jgi:hypothetical protein
MRRFSHPVLRPTRMVLAIEMAVWQDCRFMTKELRTQSLLLT